MNYNYLTIHISMNVIDNYLTSFEHFFYELLFVVGMLTQDNTIAKRGNAHTV